MVCGCKDVVFPDCPTAEEKPTTTKANAAIPHLSEDMKPTLSHEALGL
jgi:hypothetical protein